MSGWGATLTGLSSVLSMLDNISIEVGDDAAYVVGTNVRYSIFVEMGTSDMSAQPYLGPAAREVERELPRLAQGADSLDDLLSTAALAIERRAKQKCPVDSGTLRSSIKAQKVN